MSIPKRTGAVALGLAAVVLMGGLPLVAQEPAKPKQDPATPRKKQDPARRVPDYFGQIGLTTEQRASIYGIQTKRIEKISALEKQIADEKAGMIADCEAVLNETQKKLLENLRKNASGTAAKPAEPAKTTN